jgi:hypothetical protein
MQSLIKLGITSKESLKQAMIRVNMLPNDTEKSKHQSYLDVSFTVYTPFLNLYIKDNNRKVSISTKNDGQAKGT